MVERDGVGAAQVLQVLDIDGDRTEEILVGRGYARGALDAPATVTIYRLGALSKAVETVPLVLEDGRGLLRTSEPFTLHQGLPVGSKVRSKAASALPMFANTAFNAVGSGLSVGGNSPNKDS